MRRRRIKVVTRKYVLGLVQASEGEREGGEREQFYLLFPDCVLSMKYCHDLTTGLVLVLR